MKFLSIFIILISLLACSSDYAPSEGMLKFKQNMSPDLAKSILQDAIWLEAGPVSVCAARGFWYDEGANLRIGMEKIDLVAYRKGKFIKSKGSGFEREDFYEKEYYDYEFKYSDLKYIVLYGDPSRLVKYKACHKLYEGQNIVVIDLYAGDESNIKFTVLRDELDKVMAAISIMMPELKIKEYSRIGQ